MKRDFDLIRRILIDIENAPVGKFLDKFGYPTFDESVIYEHVSILEETGLIKAKIIKAGTKITAVYITKGKSLAAMIINAGIGV